jgi:hypothetical protein
MHDSIASVAVQLGLLQKLRDWASTSPVMQDVIVQGHGVQAVVKVMHAHQRHET